jgi:hypothetical protein
MIDQKATLPVEAAVVLRLIAEVQASRKAAGGQPHA